MDSLSTICWTPQSRCALLTGRGAPTLRALPPHFTAKSLPTRRARLCKMTFFYGDPSFLLQQNFVTDFAIGIGLDNVAQCQELITEVTKLAVLFLVLEKLGLVAAPTWFERWVDHLSIESTLLRRQRVVLWDRVAAFGHFHRRIESC